MARESDIFAGAPVEITKTTHQFQITVPGVHDRSEAIVGNLYGLPTWFDKHLAEQQYIVFKAGTHTDAIALTKEPH